MAWKKAECPTCPHYDHCAKDVETIEECIGDEKDELSGDPIGFLAKFALIELTRKLQAGISSYDRSEAVNRVLGSKKNIISITKHNVFKGASLYCSDRKLYEACRN